MIEKRFFQKTEKGDIYAYTLDNGKGLKAEILNLGGILRRLAVNGVDVVLGRDDYQKYLYDDCYFGAIVGRNANVIEDAILNINGKEYKLSKNYSTSNIHGGKESFSRKIWTVEEADSAEPSLIFRLFSKDGEEGFPANAEVTVTYTLTNDNSFKIHYEAAADGDTVMNLTNHSYFNLNGHNSGDIKNHILWLNCDFFTPITKELIPDGRILSVKGTLFDFTKPKAIGIDKSDEQLIFGMGYDHNFSINGRGFRKFAVLEGDKTGIKMESYTDCPAVQLYIGNEIEDTPSGKNGVVYKNHQGVCLETQVFPNFTKYSHFPDGYLKKGEKYHSVTEYRFSM